MDALSPGSAEHDVLSTLEAEHDEAQELLERLVDSHGSRERKRLLEKLKQVLLPHIKAEERAVYDAVLALRNRGARIDGNEGYIEHSLVDQSLKELDRLGAGTVEFAATARVLKELVDHHVREEEKNIWTQIRDNFSAEQREQMNRAFLVAKKRVRVI